MLAVISQSENSWVLLAERLGVQFLVLVALGYFFIKYLWPFLQDQMAQSLVNLKEQNEHWRDELRRSRDTYLQATKKSEDNIDKIVTRHEEFSKRHEKALERLTDSIKTLHCQKS